MSKNANEVLLNSFLNEEDRAKNTEALNGTVAAAEQYTAELLDNYKAMLGDFEKSFVDKVSCNLYDTGLDKIGIAVTKNLEERVRLLWQEAIGGLKNKDCALQAYNEFIDREYEKFESIIANPNPRATDAEAALSNLIKNCNDEEDRIRKFFERRLENFAVGRRDENVLPFRPPMK